MPLLVLKLCRFRIITTTLSALHKKQSKKAFEDHLEDNLLTFLIMLARMEIDLTDLAKHQQPFHRLRSLKLAQTSSEQLILLYRHAP